MRRCTPRYYTVEDSSGQEWEHPYDDHVRHNPAKEFRVADCPVSTTVSHKREIDHQGDEGKRRTAAAMHATPSQPVQRDQMTSPSSSKPTATPTARPFVHDHRGIMIRRRSAYTSTAPEVGEDYIQASLNPLPMLLIHMCAWLLLSTHVCACTVAVYYQRSSLGLQFPSRSRKMPTNILKHLSVP